MLLILSEKQGLIIDCNAVVPCPDGGWWQPGTCRGENALGRKIRFCSDFFDPNPENKRILMIIRWMSRAHPDISNSQVDKYANAAEEFHKAGRREEPF